MIKEKTTFLKEIFEEPESLKALIGFYRNRGAARLKEWVAKIEKNKRVLFVGMGTSEVAPQMVLDGLARQGIEAFIMNAGELLHYPRSFDGLIVLISQSGESVETAKLARQFSDSGNLISITKKQKYFKTLSNNCGKPNH